MTFKQVAEILLSKNYRFAKTMAKHPHWYTLEKEWTNKDIYSEVVDFINENAYIEYFFKTPYKMFNLNGHKYWAMKINDGTGIINRTHSTYQSDYDKIAFDYYNLFSNEESIKEEDDLFKILDVKGSILDIGCGYGMYLNHFAPEVYTGIDSSKYLLDILKEKHFDYTDNVINCAFEDFYTTQKYDTILALFGTASYLSDESVNKIKDILQPNGKAYLMYYKEGYNPKTHIELQLNKKYKTILQEGIIFNNYNIIEVNA
jgi:2-polyprenyl-3-methyl-5-hydroxy-6-metoxy-1,4-benzoquinol methylase